MTHAILQKKTAIIALLAIIILSMSFGMAFAQQVDTCRVRTTVTAQEVTDLGGTGGPHNSGANLPITGTNAGINGLICTYSLIKFAVNIGTIIIFALAAITFMYAGFLYLTAGSNAENRTKANNYLVFGVVGLIIALLARVIPAMVRGLIGG